VTAQFPLHEIKKKSLLWKLDGVDLPGASYLFGTMHLPYSAAFRNRAIVYEKIRECQAFALEFNLNEKAPPQIDSTILHLPEAKTLKDFMPAKRYRKLREFFLKTSSLDLDPINHLLPLLITNFLTKKILAEENIVSLDEHLFDFAKSEERLLLGIETYLEQYEIMKKIPIDFQLKGLLEIGKNSKKFRQNLVRTAHLYAEADLQKLYKSVKKGAGRMRKLLLFQRNLIMAERINRMLREQTLFAAIGAGHLGGEKGILRLLKRKGLTVTPSFPRMGNPLKEGSNGIAGQ